MNLSTGINLEKELNAIMRRVKRPKIHDKEECIFCCDDNYDYENDEQEDEGFNIRNMMQFDSKPLSLIHI